MISCGSNLENPPEQLRVGQEKVAGLDRVKLLKTSKAYKTKPVSLDGQPDFMNSVLLIETSLKPQALLKKLLEIETSQGRKREVLHGPRTLDLDLIFYGNEIVKSSNLEIPHPRAHEREFVLRPLCDIAPGWVHPVFKKNAAYLLEKLS